MSNSPNRDFEKQLTHPCRIGKPQNGQYGKMWLRIESSHESSILVSLLGTDYIGAHEELCFIQRARGCVAGVLETVAMQVTLSNSEANALMNMPKRFVTTSGISFPSAGEKASFDIVSNDGRERFIADVHRGRIRLTKCSYQERYGSIVALVRLDLDGRPHENPDGTVVPCPHLHIYRENFADKWAEPIPSGMFGNTADLVVTFRDFMAFCNVSGVPEIQTSLI